MTFYFLPFAVFLLQYPALETYRGEPSLHTHIHTRTKAYKHKNKHTPICAQGGLPTKPNTATTLYPFTFDFFFPFFFIIFFILFTSSLARAIKHTTKDDRSERA